MAPVSGEYAEPVHYKLYGVLCHRSESAGIGHYTVDALHPDGESGSAEARLHIDDEAVSVVCCFIVALLLVRHDVSVVDARISANLNMGA